MNLPFDIRPVVYLVTAGGIFYFMLWRALAFVRPSLLTLQEDEPPEGSILPVSLEAVGAELKALGFLSVGSHLERWPLRSARIYYDFCRDGTLFASVTEGRAGPKVTLWTVFEDGALMCISNVRRPSFSWDRQYYAGFVEGASVSRLLLAQQRWAAAFVPRKVEMTQKARMELAQMWLDGPGRKEIRLRHVRGLLWTLAGVGLLVQMFL